MATSELRSAQARINGSRSKGPVSEAGKARASESSYKHGMTGQGIVLARHKAEEVERKVAQYRADLGPIDEVQSDIVRRAALAAIRMQACVEYGHEVTASRVRRAISNYDETRETEADRLMANLADDPAGNLRRLKRMPEGLSRLIDAWQALRSDLLRPVAPIWDETHEASGILLTGRKPGGHGYTRFDALSLAARGDGSLLDASDIAEIDEENPRIWTHAHLVHWIDGEIAGLVAHRETLDHEAIAADRAGAPTLAQFDPGAEATLVRKYEAAAEREFRRSLRDLKDLQKSAHGSAPHSPPAAPPAPPRSPSYEALSGSSLGSFFPTGPDFDEDPFGLPWDALGLPTDDLAISAARPSGRPKRR